MKKIKNKDIKYQLDAFYREQETTESKQQIWIWKKNQVQFYCEFKYCDFILNKNI